MYFLPCLFASCPPFPSWQCLWLLHEFPCPGCCEGPEEHSLGLAVSEQAWLQSKSCSDIHSPNALFTTKVASVIALVLWTRGGLALLEVLDKGMDFCLVKG